MNLGGRPREYDRDKIARDLVEWAKLPDSINLNKFCAINCLAPPKLTLFANECPKFREAYEEAKAHLGYRREQLLNEDKIHVKAYDLNANTYDYFLKQERREQAEYEARLSADANNNVNPEDIAKYNALMQQLAQVRSALKMDASKINEEQKS